MLLLKINYPPPRILFNGRGKVQPECRKLNDSTQLILPFPLLCIFTFVSPIYLYTVAGCSLRHFKLYNIPLSTTKWIRRTTLDIYSSHVYLLLKVFLHPHPLIHSSASRTFWKWSFRQKAQLRLIPLFIFMTGIHFKNYATSFKSNPHL